MKHICGLECERYCCNIEGHDFNVETCNYCEIKLDDYQMAQEALEIKGDEDYEASKEKNWTS